MAAENSSPPQPFEFVAAIVSHSRCHVPDMTMTLTFDLDPRMTPQPPGPFWSPYTTILAYAPA